MKTTEIRRLRKAIRSLDRLADRQIKRCCGSVTVSQCHVLLGMEAQGETTTQRLARELRLDKSTVSLTVDALVKQGRVSRTADREDRRVTRLNLTAKGQALCDALNKVNDEYLVNVFERIPRGHRQAVVDGFVLFVEAIAQHEDAGS